MDAQEHFSRKTLEKERGVEEALETLGMDEASYSEIFKQIADEWETA